MTKRAMWVGGIAGVAILLVGGLAFAASKKAASSGGGTPPAPPPSGGGGGTQRWQNATDADVRRDGVQSVYSQLLSQPMGTEKTGVYNGRTWRFVVCGGAGCTPPSSYQKDVRGFILVSG